MRRILLIVFLGLTHIAIARHIVGGGMTYECLSVVNGQMTIELSLTIYRDAFQDGRDAPSPFDRAAEIGVWVGTSGNYSFLNSFIMEPTGEPTNFPNTGTLISPPPNPCFEEIIVTDKVTYTQIITLDVIGEPLLLAYQRCCRNNNISNMINSGVRGSVYSLIIDPISQEECNSSPVFNKEEDIVICAGLFQTLDFSAFDGDGDLLSVLADSLVYRFCQPISAGGVEGSSLGTGGRPTDCDGVTPSPMECGPQQFIKEILLGDPDVPIPGNPGMTIDPATGIISGTPTIMGTYIVAVCVEEWKNGFLVGEIRREFQFTVVSCLLQTEMESLQESLPTIMAQCDTIGTINTFNICDNPEIELKNFTNADSNIVAWRWTIENGSNFQEIITDEWQPRITFPGTGEYRIELIINPNEECADTCVRFINFERGSTLDSDSGDIFCNRGITLTNAFTPNGIGRNNLLKFSDEEVIDDSELWIYNRWGDLIYNKKNYTNDWGGGGYPDGIYFYVLKIKDQLRRKTLTILR